MQRRFPGPVWENAIHTHMQSLERALSLGRVLTSWHLGVPLRPDSEAQVSSGIERDYNFWQNPNHKGKHWEYPSMCLPTSSLGYSCTPHLLITGGWHEEARCYREWKPSQNLEVISAWLRTAIRMFLKVKYLSLAKHYITVHLTDRESRLVQFNTRPLSEV